MKKILTILICYLLLAACNEEKTVPKNVLNLSKMESVMWDMFLAQSLAQQQASADSGTTVVIETKKLSDAVFKFHGISEKKFSESYQWYLKHPVLLDQILDSIYSQKSRREEDLLPDQDHPQLLEKKPQEKGTQIKSKTILKPS